MPVNTENKLMFARGRGYGEMGKMSEDEWEIQASSYGMKKSHGCVIQHRE